MSETAAQDNAHIRANGSCKLIEGAGDQTQTTTKKSSSSTVDELNLTNPFVNSLVPATPAQCIQVSWQISVQWVGNFCNNAKGVLEWQSWRGDLPLRRHWPWPNRGFLYTSYDISSINDSPETWLSPNIVDCFVISEKTIWMARRKFSALNLPNSITFIACCRLPLEYFGQPYSKG